MKKILCALSLTLSLVLACAAPAFALEGMTPTKVLIGGVELEGVSADYSEYTAACVPIRAVCEALGCEVEWIPGGDPEVVVSNANGEKVMGYNANADVYTRYYADGTSEEVDLMMPIYANPGYITMVNGYVIANVLDIPVFVEDESDPAQMDAMFHYDADNNVCFPKLG